MNLRGRIPSSVSCDSVIDGQTPDSDVSSFNYSLNEDLVQEAIYALTGKTGKYLTRDVTGELKLVITARNLSPQDAVALLKLAEIGRLHNEVQRYTNPNSEYFLCGLFGKGLISQLKNELTQFYGLIAYMQDNVR